MRASGMLREYKTEDAPGSTFDGSHFLTAPCDKAPRVDVCAYCPSSGPEPKNQLLMDNEFHVRPTGAWKAMLGRRRPMPGSKTTRRASDQSTGRSRVRLELARKRRASNVRGFASPSATAFFSQAG
eukprot:scaffold35915_cov69-Phaeocystis_antarctica.AAC.2